MKKEITINGIMKLVQFTKPQAAIIDKLQNGSKATYINTHRRDGGDFVWFEKDGNYWGAECVGYRAFNGAMPPPFQGETTRHNQHKKQSIMETAIKTYEERWEEVKGLKVMHPDVIILYRVMDTYEAYDEDAKVLKELCGCILVRHMEGGTCKSLQTEFECKDLDRVLPKLIRGGHRIAITG